ncbi:MAG: DUF3795 domain-containing protein [Firmicutes bacterium]|jgi:hypothetical protein|nr:DUF3795 domain-containing protein [Bacillota bacterium]
MAVTEEHVLKALAPCGLSCEKCFAYNEGIIAKHARALRERLGNFDVYAQRFTKLGLTQFENWKAFKELLEYLASGDCLGCRQGTCKWPNCGVVECYKTKKMRFCFECPEFPCKKTNFDPHLEARWIAMNERMKEIGPVAYYEETRDQPRYR